MYVCARVCTLCIQVSAQVRRICSEVKCNAWMGNGYLGQHEHSEVHVHRRDCFMLTHELGVALGRSCICMVMLTYRSRCWSWFCTSSTFAFTDHLVCRAQAARSPQVMTRQGVSGFSRPRHQAGLALLAWSVQLSCSSVLPLDCGTPPPTPGRSVLLCPLLLVQLKGALELGDCIRLCLSVLYSLQMRAHKQQSCIPLCIVQRAWCVIQTFMQGDASAAPLPSPGLAPARTMGLSKNGNPCIVLSALVEADVSVKTTHACPLKRSVFRHTTSKIFPN